MGGKCTGGNGLNVKRIIFGDYEIKSQFKSR